ncbi:MULTISPECIES: ABC transporter permease [unclassified Clostridium]|uniref:ABC transporter permease n=1 Tax=unclassified Clostridium TaxID=2614128 RepID=UPI0002979691|nr:MULTISPECIES: ABC transporter permease [unclassified Clostridium]EKQ53830.1 MAG: ABC-type nitrate/sulfonate/bicarbonate transport system, permease component [Clostridium sp. Maddingley MBC34-26]
MKDVIKGKLLRYTGITVVLILWEVLPRLSLVNSDYLPPLSRVLLELFSLSNGSYLYMNIMVSIWRVMIGLVISISISTILGLSLGFFCYKFSEKLNPLLRFFGQINPYSLFPLFVVFLGINEEAKIGIVIWTSVWPMMFHTISAARSVDPVLIKLANSMSASKLQLFYKVIIPATIPYIFRGIREGVQMAFFILTSSEMTGSTAGLGYIIHNAGMNFLIPRLYAGGLCIVVISVILNLFLVSFQKRLLFWKEEVEVFDDIKTRKVKRISKLQVSCIILVFLFIFIQGSIQVQKAYDYQNNPKNGFGYVE